MTISVVQFGGSNCDRDTVRALSHLGFNAELTWYKDDLPREPTGVVLPGGFSYGDYLRAGAMAAHTPIMDVIRESVADGVPLLGICNGAQIACEAGFIPGTFTTNASARFRCDHINVRVETTETPWTAAYNEGDVLELPIAHGEGRYELPDAALDELEREDRILFRYCSPTGEITPEANPNGSKRNIAGVLGEHNHVAVLMPHPERVSLPDIGPTDGQGILRGFG